MEYRTLFTKMDFDFFQSLSDTEAKEFLKAFLTTEAQMAASLLTDCRKDGLVCDYTIGTLPKFLKWLSAKLVTFPQMPDRALPMWIRQSESYVKNLFEFDEPSKRLILRAAYYLGESFVRSFPILEWSIGNPETLMANMPVITGFKSRIEMAPIMICENLFGRVAADPNKLDEIDIAITYWTNAVSK